MFPQAQIAKFPTAVAFGNGNWEIMTIHASDFPSLAVFWSHAYEPICVLPVILSLGRRHRILNAGGTLAPTDRTGWTFVGSS
jgi:hypothetical protein